MTMRHVALRRPFERPTGPGIPWSTYLSRVRPEAVIIQRRMTQYRLPLFNLMREKLDAAGVELIVVDGDPLPE